MARKHVGEFDYGAAARFFACIQRLVVFRFFLVLMFPELSELVFADGILAVCLALTRCDSRVLPFLALMASPFFSVCSEGMPVLCAAFSRVSDFMRHGMAHI